MKRRTIGENPLDALVPVQAPPTEETRGSTRTTRKIPKMTNKKKAQESPQEPPRGGKERLTVHLPVEVINRAKDAVFWSPGLTLAGFAEAAFLKALEKLEKENGGPFPPRKAELKGGRPVR